MSLVGDSSFYGELTAAGKAWAAFHALTMASSKSWNSIVLEKIVCKWLYTHYLLHEIYNSSKSYEIYRENSSFNS